MWLALELGPELLLLPLLLVLLLLLEPLLVLLFAPRARASFSEGVQGNGTVQGKGPSPAETPRDPPRR